MKKYYSCQIVKMLGEAATKNLNVFLLGLSFLGLFAANYTMTNLQQTIIDSAMDNSTSDDPDSGYVEGELIVFLIFYRVSHLLVDLGWISLDLGLMGC